MVWDLADLHQRRHRFRDVGQFFNQLLATIDSLGGALTAGHTYDLPTYPAQYGDDLFGWRDDLVQLRLGDEVTPETSVRKAFGDYLLRRNDDPNKRNRAPWDSAEK